MQDAPVVETELRTNLRRKILAMNANEKQKNAFVPPAAASAKKLGKCENEEQCRPQATSCAPTLWYADQFVFEIGLRKRSVPCAWEPLEL